MVRRLVHPAPETAVAVAAVAYDQRHATIERPEDLRAEAVRRMYVHVPRQSVDGVFVVTSG